MTWIKIILQFGVEPVSNLGIGGDKVENVLWRIRNGELPRHSKLIVVHVGTNNIQRDSPNDIVCGLKNICHAIQHSAPLASVCISTILPRCCSSVNKQKILETNAVLRDCVPLWASELHQDISVIDNDRMAWLN